MEGLVRLVAESLERHGVAVPPPSLEWSPWTPLDPNLCLTAPCRPGLFVIAEPMVLHSISVKTSNQLVVLKAGQTKDLGVEMARLCYDSPLYDRVIAGRCLVRFAVVDDEAQRALLYQAFTLSLASSSVHDSKDSPLPVDLAAPQLPTEFLLAHSVKPAKT